MSVDFATNPIAPTAISGNVKILSSEWQRNRATGPGFIRIEKQRRTPICVRQYGFQRVRRSKNVDQDEPFFLLGRGPVVRNDLRPKEVQWCRGDFLCLRERVFGAVAQ